MPTTPRPIRFHHRGRIVEVGDVHPTRSVLDWLREDAACTGTKEGCNEGDCGACTVVIGELPGASTAPSSIVQGLALRSVNACIQFLPTLDGKALFSVEDLKRRDGTLHPVQQSMVDCHGSQCGFCTPGIVMSLWSTYERHCERGSTPTRQQLADELSGNLCRCTGYRPIVDAGVRMFEAPPARLDTAPVIAALRAIASRETFVYAAPHPTAPRTAQGAAPVHRFQAPRTIEALAELVQAHPQARILAGSTDIGLWVNKGLRDLPEIISTGEVDELKRVEPNAGSGLTIHAGASLEDAWAAICRRHPEFTDLWLRFSSLPIRNAGTMGGNVANGSPIGDAPPALIALDATVVLRLGQRVRRMPLADFYIDYMKNHLEAGEFVLAIELPRLPAARQVRGYKISKRYDCDISAVCGAFAIELDARGQVCEVRLVYGGMAGIVKRAAGAERAMLGQPWSEATLRAAQTALDADFTPLTDMRASKAYRTQIARNLLERLWLETRVDRPLAATETSVHATLAHRVFA